MLADDFENSTHINVTNEIAKETKQLRVIKKQEKKTTEKKRKTEEKLVVQRQPKCSNKSACICEIAEKLLDCRAIKVNTCTC